MSTVVPRVALIVETSLAYGRGILSGVSKYIAEHEPWLIYVDERTLGDPPPVWLKQWDCQGVIMRAQTTKIVQMVASLRVPAIDTLLQLRGLRVPAVVSDSQAVAKLAADHFLERHFKHFAFVGVEGALWSDMRRDCLIEILSRSGHACHVYSPPSARHSSSNREKDFRHLAKWLRDLPKPVGVVTPFDLRGRSVLDACRWNGLAVPEHVAVIGVGNDEVLCNLGEPALSSVKLNFELLGYEAAKLLDRLMKGGKPPARPITIRPLGVATRRSTDIAAVADVVSAQALRYIQRHACEGIGVAQVAKHCGVSRRVIDLSFEKHVGISPHEQIVRIKIARVKQLLVETDYPLEVIATKSGFAHAPYMSVLFKRITGQTPGDFRRASSTYSHPRIARPGTPEDQVG